MNGPNRGSLGSASMLGRDAGDGHEPFDDDEGHAPAGTAVSAEVGSPELRKALAEVKGQAQFLLYLADQVEESLEQLANEGDSCQSAFLCKVLSMYSAQMESKHQGLGEKIAEACQEIYVTVREYDPT